jgi:hypothetical protein
VLDLIREVKPPFNPTDVVAEFAGTFRAYRVQSVWPDRYGGEWVSEAFRRHGLLVRPAEKAKSDLYRELLPAVMARRVDLLDDPKLLAQLVGLERRVGRGGRDSIDHPPGAHDDVANSTAGALVMALSRAGLGRISQMRLHGL